MHDRGYACESASSKPSVGRCATGCRKTMRKQRSLSSYPALPPTIVCLTSKLITFPSGQGAWCGIPLPTMSCSIAFGDKSWDNFKNFFQTQDVEFLFLSQRPRLAAFGGSIAPKMPVLKLSRPLACKPPVAIVSESARVACASCAKPQLTGLRHRRSKGVASGGLPMSRR